MHCFISISKDQNIYQYLKIFAMLNRPSYFVHIFYTSDTFGSASNVFPPKSNHRKFVKPTLEKRGWPVYCIHTYDKLGEDMSQQRANCAGDKFALGTKKDRSNHFWASANTPPAFNSCHTLL